MEFYFSERFFLGTFISGLRAFISGKISGRPLITRICLNYFCSLLNIEVFSVIFSPRKDLEEYVT